MTTSKSTPWLALVSALLVALALMAVLVAVSGAQPLQAINVTELVPSNGSTVAAGQPVSVSAFIESDVSIDTDSVSVRIDGAQITGQLVVGSRAERVGFNATSTFTIGSHTLAVTARNTNGETVNALSTFTAVQGAGTTTATTTAATTAAAVTTGTTTATTTAVTTAAATTVATTASTVAGAIAVSPVQLPAAGGIPADLAILALLGLSTVAAGIGMRVRIR